MQEIQRKTEKKLIPKDWDFLPIGDLAFVRRGASPRPIRDSKYFAEYGRGWIRISDVTSSKRKLQKTSQYLSELGVAKSVPVNKDDLIMSICATIGKPIILDMRACIHDGFVLFSKFHDSLTTEYFYYQLQRLEPKFVALGQEGTQKNLNTSLVKRTQIPVPPISEQKKIASILSTVDSAIEKTDEIIQETRQLKKGLMQKLFTEGIRHTKFKETKMGRLPESWQVYTTNVLTIRITDGSHFSPKAINTSKYLIATVKDVTDYGLDISTCIRISESDYKKLVLNGCKPFKEDVLLTKDGTVGKSLIWNYDHPIVVLSSIAIFSPRKELLDSVYFKYFLESPFCQNWLKRLSGGTALQRVILRDLKKIKVLVPPLPEQRKIAKFLSEVDSKIEKEQSTKEQLILLKKGLMQVLLTGKVRVKV